MGRGADARTVFMVDFGLARLYVKVVKGEDGSEIVQMRRPRERVGFRGTVRYAPIAIHEGQVRYCRNIFVSFPPPQPTLAITITIMS